MAKEKPYTCDARLMPGGRPLQRRNVCYVVSCGAFKERVGDEQAVKKM